MNGVDFFLSKTLGEDFFESLAKVELWKPGTKSTIDHEEIRTALQIVPRTLMSFLIHHLSGMEIGENKSVELPVQSEGAMLNATKHERDVFSGNIEQGGKIVVDFKFRSIPGVGLIVMSAFELYNAEKLLESPSTSINDYALDKIQRLIDERLALHDLIGKVVDKKVAEKDGIHQLLLMKLTEELHKEKLKSAKVAEDIAEVRKISESSSPQSEPYFRGMTNGLEVANVIASEKEPRLIEAPKPLKKGSPVKDFLDSRKKKAKKGEFSIELVKGEKINCPDCGGIIFNENKISACICFGDSGKVFLKKTENGIKISFGRGWDKENSEMLLEILRRKNGQK